MHRKKIRWTQPKNLVPARDMLCMFKTTTTLIRSLLITAFPAGHVSDVIFQSDYMTVPKNDTSHEMELAVGATIYFNNYYSYRAALNIMNHYLNIRAAWDEKTLGIVVTQQLVDALRDQDTMILLQHVILDFIKMDFHKRTQPTLFGAVVNKCPLPAPITSKTLISQ